jgi:hydrogenase maturation protein HypF
MLLESLAEEFEGASPEPWPMPLTNAGSDAPCILDWEPCLRGLVEDAGTPAERAARFHTTLAAGLVLQAEAIRARTGIEAVSLSGGVFQNRILAEAAIVRLGARGFRVYLPREFPANDGGLCFGQIIEAAASLAGPPPAGIPGEESNGSAGSDSRKP